MYHERARRQFEVMNSKNSMPIRRLTGARLVGFSSDYVFDGSAGPYSENVDPRPISVYGRIKCELEEMLVQAGHTVIRTTTVFGMEASPAKNFVLRLVASLRRGEAVRVPNDQISTPTFADDLATASMLIPTAGPGVWHIAGPDLMSRSELALRVASVFDLATAPIQAVLTRELRQSAARPLRGGLLCERFMQRFGPPHRGTVDALRALRSRMEKATAIEVT